MHATSDHAGRPLLPNSNPFRSASLRNKKSLKLSIFRIPNSFSFVTSVLIRNACLLVYPQLHRAWSSHKHCFDVSEHVIPLGGIGAQTQFSHILGFHFRAVFRSLSPVQTRVLNVECPDRRGLVHAVTGVLLGESLNVVGNQEFVDPTSNRFFMRTEIEGHFDEPRVISKLHAALGHDAIVRFPPLAPKRIVMLASKEHHCVADVLVRHMFRELNCTLLAVIANHETLRPLVESFRIPFHCTPSVEGAREAHEDALLKTLAGYEFDYLVLAKYMRILSPSFVDRFAHRIINIHHSFLPAFVGARPYQQAYERGVKVIGATAHFVTSDLDQGPIIVQQVIPVDHTHSPQDLAASGHNVEQMVLARALKLVFEDRVFLCGNRTILFD